MQAGSSPVVAAILLTVAHLAWPRLQNDVTHSALQSRRSHASIRFIFFQFATPPALTVPLLMAPIVLAAVPSNTTQNVETPQNVTIKTLSKYQNSNTPATLRCAARTLAEAAQAHALVLEPRRALGRAGLGGEVRPAPARARSGVEGASALLVVFSAVEVPVRLEQISWVSWGISQDCSSRLYGELRGP